MEQNSIAPDAATPILVEIRGTFGWTPNLFKVYAHHPPLLEANWNKVKALLLKGNLRRKFKEFIALMVSRDNGCVYCVSAHSVALRGLGVSESEIAGALKGVLPPSLMDKEIALLGFVLKANLHWRNTGDEDFEHLRTLGVTDCEIVEALGVMELFAGFNRFAGALRIEVDFPDVAAA